MQYRFAATYRPYDNNRQNCYGQTDRLSFEGYQDKKSLFTKCALPEDTSNWEWEVTTAFSSGHVASWTALSN